MPWRIISGLVALIVLANANAQSGRSRQSTWGSREPWKTLSDNLIDIDVETERNNAAADQTWEDLEVMSGSGSGMDATDDEDLLTASGSGSGEGIVDLVDTFTYPRPRLTTVQTSGNPSATTTTTTTTAAPITTPTTARHLTLCQKLRENSRHLPGDFVPECDDKGNYHIMQCHGRKEPGNCWCADLRGREIPGTFLSDDIPDCLGGTNLARCIFQLVWQVRTPGLSTFLPRCTSSGDFEATQCKGDICYCVDQKFGDKVAGTEVFLPDRPVCTVTTTPQEEDVAKPIEEDIVKEIDEKAEAKATMFTPEEPSTTPRLPAEAKADINIILIIGGSVVLLLCAILLALFIIYRMKKKDEGSYPLDEPKKMPNYTYQHVPEKEFYA